jgi:hypothetical protein
MAGVGTSMFAYLNAKGRVLGLDIGDWALLLGASSLVSVIIQLSV